MKKSAGFAIALFIVCLLLPSGIQASFLSKESQKQQAQCVFSSEHLTIRLDAPHTDDIITLHYSFSDFLRKEILIDGETFTQLFFEKEPTLLIEGKPALPYISRSIILPDTHDYAFHITSSQYHEYTDVYLAPSKGDLLRSVEPENVPYMFDSMYFKDAWFPETLVSLGEPYVLRDFRGCSIQVTPFQYNPLSHLLRFYTDITVSLIPSVATQQNLIHRAQPVTAIDSDFLSIYERHFMNFDPTRYTPLQEQGKMLVITYDDFWSTMQPFVRWKTMSGIETEMVNVSKIGNANQIKEYISKYYNTKGLTFVLLVGDIQQIPTLLLSGMASDPSYSYIVGSDHYPDLFIGRFSAQTREQVHTQVERTITYEKNPRIDNDWYQKGGGVASNQGPGDDDEYDNEHIEKIRNDLLNYTYTMVDQIYDPSASASQVSQAINDGRGLINYCGHGSPTSWGTSGFSISHVNQLTNQNMLPFIWSVACNNGEFNSFDTCFAEAWMRATSNGKPTGAIATFMSSISQSWDPPMDAQDEIIDILIGSNESNKKYTFGGLSFSGCMKMNDDYRADGYRMTDSWHIFGDPSLHIRTATPTDLTVTHASQIEMGARFFEIDVTSDGTIRCAISKNNHLFGYACSNTSGHVLINFTEPITYGGNITIVVTGHNAIPYIASIPVNGTDGIPEQPSRPSGKRIARINTSYEFTSKSTDPDADNLYYLWDWGDGNLSGWLGPSPSGIDVNADHSWSTKGLYSVRVKAKDIFGVESDWSDPFVFRASLDRTAQHPILSLLQKWFPQLFSFFSQYR